MGRSVSTPSNCNIVVYTQASTDSDFWCPECDHHYDHSDIETNDDGENACPNCKCSHDNFAVRRDDQQLWDDDVENLRCELKAAFPSLDDDKRWLGNEDRVIASNEHANFGISEYCGLVAVWVRAKYRDDFTGPDEGQHFLADFWIASIDKSLRKVVADTFGETLRKIGTFSNGSAVFERASA